MHSQFRHNKLYLSLAESRRAARDEPIGDPFGGPAFGKRELPAVLAIGGMFAAGSAFAAATTTLGAIMAGMSFAGSALSLVGTISGNAKLSKIGGMLGLAGGLGMGADALFSGGNFTFSGGDMAKAPEWLGGARDALGMTPTAVPGVQTPVVDGVAQSFPVDMGGPATAEILPPGGSLNAPGAAAQPLNAPGGGVSPLNASPTDFSLAPPSGGPGLKIGPGTGTNLSSAGRAAPGFMDSLKAGNYGDAAMAAGSNMMDLAKNNPGAAMMMGNAVSGVADWLSGKTDAEIAALEAQTGFADARALQIQEEIAREKRRRANLNASYNNVRQGVSVNPNASIPQPWAPQIQAPGLIAGAMPPGG